MLWLINGQNGKHMKEMFHNRKEVIIVNIKFKNRSEISCLDNDKETRR